MGAASLMMMMMMTLLTSHVVGAVSESSADTLLADRAHPTENLLLWSASYLIVGTHPSVIAHVPQHSPVSRYVTEAA